MLLSYLFLLTFVGYKGGCWKKRVVLSVFRIHETRLGMAPPVLSLMLKLINFIVMPPGWRRFVMHEAL
jgi:hypothetical protein